MPTVTNRIAHRATGPLLGWWLRVTAAGVEHVPGDGGVLIAGNHRSFLDHFALFAVCPRPMRFLGKQELARGLTGRFNLAMGMVPVTRGGADAVAIDAVVGLLRAGEVVGVFPEGTRSPTGHLYRFRSGTARIAAAAGTPVVPVGVRGTGEVWPLGAPPPRRRPRPGVVEVRFGAVLAPPSPEARARREFTRTLRAAVAELCGQPPADGFAPITA